MPGFALVSTILTTIMLACGPSQPRPSNQTMTHTTIDSSRDSVSNANRGTTHDSISNNWDMHGMTHSGTMGSMMGGGMSGAGMMSVPTIQAGTTAVAPRPGGQIIVVQAITDQHGTRFVPTHVTVHRGDVIRLTLASGVHNIAFASEHDTSKVLVRTPLLQRPGQTYDVRIDFPKGTYRFWCDPHEQLGMVGTLVVR